MKNRVALVFGVATLVAAVLSPGAAAAQAVPEEPSAAASAADGLAGGHGWSRARSFGMGSRLSARAGSYLLGGGGGHVRLRPVSWIAVEAFTDHFLGAVDGALRHDHEGGVALQFPLLGNRWWSVYPSLGACASLVVLEPPRPGGAHVSDVHFGVRAGVGSELYLSNHWALRAQVEGIGYLGHELRAYDWTAQLSPDVQLTGAAQATLSVNLYL